MKSNRLSCTRYTDRDDKVIINVYHHFFLFVQINDSFIELKQRLDQVNESLTEIMSYLANVIAPFDGTVTVSSTIPPVQANYTTIRNWAEKILLEVEANNRTAYQNYENIMSLYDQVG